jgi:hypothetical protein
MRTRRVLLAGAVALAAVGTNVATGEAAGAATNVYEAESPANSLSGAATVTACGRCSDGREVGFAANAAGGLRFNGVSLNGAGSTALTVSYTAPAAGQSRLSVNGGPPVTLSFAGTGAVVAALTVPVTLTAGLNTLTFTSAGGLAPSIDAISVSNGAGAVGSGTNRNGGGVNAGNVDSVGPGGSGVGGASGSVGASGVGAKGAGSGATGAGGAGPTAAQLLTKVAGCKPVSNGSYESEGDSGSVPVCAANGAVYWSSGMTIDCDGQRSDQCNESTDCCYASQTAFQQSDGRPLDSAALPYIVVPGPSDIWNYGASGVRPGEVAVVIYKNQVAYAVVGDVGPMRMIGEGSHALAESLGINADPRVGGAGSGVTFIVFTGADAVVQPIEDHAGAVAIGERLAQRFVDSN